MKPNEIRDLSEQEIETRIDEEETDLAQIRFQRAVTGLENPSIVRTKRRDIARLKTILNEKRRAAESA